MADVIPLVTTVGGGSLAGVLIHHFVIVISKNGSFKSTLLGSFKFSSKSNEGSSQIWYT
jgi:hypothetical protein